MENFDQQFNKAINDYAMKNQYGVSMIPAHTHNGTDSLPIDAANITNLSWKMVTSGTYAGDFTISGLSGSMSMYKLILKSRGVASYDTALQVNGDTGANYDWYHLLGYNIGAGNLTSFTSSLAQTSIQLNNYASNYLYCTIDFDGDSTLQRFIQYELTTKTDATHYQRVAGSGIYLTATEINSLTITHLAGPTPTSGFYWLYKIN